MLYLVIHTNKYIDGIFFLLVVTEPTTGDSNGGEQEIGSDIGQLYQIFPDEVLGSGQFGVVYGGTY